MTEDNNASQPNAEPVVPHTEPVYEAEILSAVPIEIKPDAGYGEDSITIL